MYLSTIFLQPIFYLILSYLVPEATYLVLYLLLFLFPAFIWFYISDFFHNGSFWILRNPVEFQSLSSLFNNLSLTVTLCISSLSTPSFHAATATSLPSHLCCDTPPPSPRVPAFFSFNRTCSPAFTVPALRCRIHWVFKPETSLLQASSCLTSSKQQRFHATDSSHPRCCEIYSIWCCSATRTKKMIHGDGSVFFFSSFLFLPAVA